MAQWDTGARPERQRPAPTYTQHEGGGPGGTTPTDPISSPWMSALYFQAARLYIVAGAFGGLPDRYRQASDYFDWLNMPAHRGFYPGTEVHVEYTGLVFPAYLAGGTLIGDADPMEGDMDHALDVAGFVAFAIKAKTALGLSTGGGGSSPGRDEGHRRAGVRRTGRARPSTCRSTGSARRAGSTGGPAGCTS